MSQTPISGGDQSWGSGTDSMQEKATQVAQTAQESGTQTARTAADEAQNVAAEATAQARDLGQEALGQLREQAGAQQDKLVSGLRDLVDELRAMADRGGQSGLATEAARQGADKAHQAAEWLAQREPGDLLEELRGLGRRRPGAFLAGAAIAGVLAGRLTRGIASAGHDDDHSRAVDERSEATVAAEAPSPLGEPDPLASRANPTIGEGAYPLPGTVDNPVARP